MFSAAKETVSASARVLRLFTNKQRRTLICAVLLMAITGGLTTIPPLVIGMLVDDLLETKYESFSPAIPFLLAILVAVVAKELITVCRKWLVEDTCTKIQKSQTVGLVSHLLRVDLSLFGQERIGSLNGRLHRSIEGLIRLVKLGFLDFCPAVFAAGFALVVAVTQQPLVGAVMGISVVVGFVLILWQVSSQRGIRIGLLRDREAMDGTVVETLGGIETVRASNTEETEANKVAKVAERLRRREILHHFQMALFDAGKFFSESGFHIITISISIWFAIVGRISVGEVLMFSMLYLSVAAPLRELHRILDEAHESTLRVRDLFALIDDFPQDESFEEVSDAPTLDLSGTVPIFEFSDVRFAYPNGKCNGHVLNDLSFKIQKGTKVGCVGRSGSGKSTTAKLMLRLFGSSGNVYFGGVPMSLVSRQQIAKHIGYVPQNPFVFSGSIRDNIAYGFPDVTLEEVIRAAKAAHLHADIMRMGGYDADVAENGKDLSGGQRQRLVLARLFLKQPDVIILDEATASLDNITEASVHRAFENLTQGRTVFVIAHRLNTIENTDQILVFHDGSLAEVGSYNVLVESNGALAELQNAG